MNASEYLEITDEEVRSVLVEVRACIRSVDSGKSDAKWAVGKIEDYSAFVMRGVRERLSASAVDGSGRVRDGIRQRDTEEPA